MKTLTVVLARILIFCACVALLGCAKDTTPSVPVVDSKVPVLNQIYWLDDERIIFVGIREYKKPVLPQQKELLIWNIKANQISLYKKGVPDFCYSRGNISYFAWTETGVGSVPQRYQGAFGQEVPVGREKWLNPIDCLLMDSKPSADAAGIWWRPLLAEHGKLGTPIDTSINKALLYAPAGGGSTIPLPMGNRQVENIRYHSFKDAYLLIGSYFDPARGINSSPWPAKTAHPVWWLYPTGKVEQLEIPPPWGEGMQFFPAAPGVIVVGMDHTMRDPGPDDAGAFLLEPNKPIRLIRGAVRNIAISPSGCRIALHHSETLEIERAGGATLKSLELCANKPGKS